MAANSPSILNTILGSRKAYTLLVGMWNDTTTLKSNWAGFFRVKHALSLWPRNSTTRYLQKRSENVCPQKTCMWMITEVLLIMAKSWKWSLCPSTVNQRTRSCVVIQCNMVQQLTFINYWYQQKGGLAKKYCAEQTQTKPDKSQTKELQ